MEMRMGKSLVVGLFNEKHDQVRLEGEEDGGGGGGGGGVVTPVVTLKKGKYEIVVSIRESLGMKDNDDDDKMKLIVYSSMSGVEVKEI